MCPRECAGGFRRPVLLGPGLPAEKRPADGPPPWGRGLDTDSKVALTRRRAGGRMRGCVQSWPPGRVKVTDVREGWAGSSHGELGAHEPDRVPAPRQRPRGRGSWRPGAEAGVPSALPHPSTLPKWGAWTCSLASAFQRRRAWGPPRHPADAAWLGDRCGCPLCAEVCRSGKVAAGKKVPTWARPLGVGGQQPPKRAQEASQTKREPVSQWPATAKGAARATVLSTDLGAWAPVQRASVGTSSGHRPPADPASPGTKGRQVSRELMSIREDFPRGGSRERLSRVWGGSGASSVQGPLSP